MVDKSVCEEAHEIVSTNRGGEYRPWQEQAPDIASILNILYPDLHITAQQWTVGMIVYKLHREAGSPKRDNRVDGAGYFELLDKLEVLNAIR